MKEDLVWYAGYGSNLNQKRFYHYLQGGKYELGGNEAKACNNPTLPKEKKLLMIPYSLYFAKSSKSWEGSAVAFLGTTKLTKAEDFSYGLAYLITREQYEHVRSQEGQNWYNEEINLGQEGEYPILTITSKTEIVAQKPLEPYLKTIAIGLSTEWNLNKTQIAAYLVKKNGVNGFYTNEQLEALCI